MAQDKSIKKELKEKLASQLSQVVQPAAGKSKKVKKLIDKSSKKIATAVVKKKKKDEKKSKKAVKALDKELSKKAKKEKKAVKAA